MNIVKRHRLKRQQKELTRVRDVYEQLQTENGNNECFCRYVQNKMDSLDEQVESIRCVLEGRWRE